MKNINLEIDDDNFTYASCEVFYENDDSEIFTSLDCIDIDSVLEELKQYSYFTEDDILSVIKKHTYTYNNLKEIKFEKELNQYLIEGVCYQIECVLKGE